jgi:hypothetical protein
VFLKFRAKPETFGFFVRGAPHSGFFFGVRIQPQQHKQTPPQHMHQSRIWNKAFKTSSKSWPSSVSNDQGTFGIS